MYFSKTISTGYKNNKGVYYFRSQNVFFAKMYFSKCIVLKSALATKTRRGFPFQISMYFFAKMYFTKCSSQNVFLKEHQHWIQKTRKGFLHFKSQNVFFSKIYFFAKMYLSKTISTGYKNKKGVYHFIFFQTKT